MTNYENEFKAKFPNARHVRDNGQHVDRYTVYAGDYLCSEGSTKREAYRLAFDFENQNLITPDPTETATTEGHPA
jgi:hypothetical protein